MEPSGYSSSISSSCLTLSNSEDSAVEAMSSSTLDQRIDDLIRTMSEEEPPASLKHLHGPSVSRHNSEAAFVVKKRRHIAHSRGSQTDNPSENSEESTSFSDIQETRAPYSRTNSVVYIEGPPLEPGFSALLVNKTRTLFQKVKGKTSKMKGMSRMAFSGDKIIKNIRLGEQPIDIHLTEHLYIMIHTLSEDNIFLGNEKLKHFNLMTIDLGLTQSEQELLLNFACPQTALVEAFECNQVIEKASKKKRLIKTSNQEELEIVHVPFLYISMTSHGEVLKITFECKIRSKQDPTEFQFRKTTEIYRIREEPELLAVEYSLERVELSSK